MRQIYATESIFIVYETPNYIIMFVAYAAEDEIHFMFLCKM